MIAAPPVPRLLIGHTCSSFTNLRGIKAPGCVSLAARLFSAVGGSLQHWLPVFLPVPDLPVELDSRTTCLLVANSACRGLFCLAWLPVNLPVSVPDETSDPSFTICAENKSCFYSPRLCCTWFLVWILTSRITYDFSLVAHIYLVFFFPASEGGTINILQSLDKITQPCQTCKDCLNFCKYSQSWNSYFQSGLTDFKNLWNEVILRIWFWSECHHF